MREAFITHHNVISSLGFSSGENFDHLKNEESGIQKFQRENGDVYYSSQVNKEILNKAFSKIGDITLYTTLEKMMLLSVHSILKESNLKITQRTGLIIATTKGNVDVLSPKSIFFKTVIEAVSLIFSIAQVTSSSRPRVSLFPVRLPPSHCQSSAVYPARSDSKRVYVLPAAKV